MSLGADFGCIMMRFRQAEAACNGRYVNLYTWAYVSRVGAVLYILSRLSDVHLKFAAHRKVIENSIGAILCI